MDPGVYWKALKKKKSTVSDIHFNEILSISNSYILHFFFFFLLSAVVLKQLTVTVITVSVIY